MMTTKTINGKQHYEELPIIPHITANIIPLSTILKNYSEESYKELTQLLSTLQSSTNSDLERKKSLLLLLVKLRENFIRLYVLNKWSVNSIQFGKLIDLLNWLRLTIEQISLHSIWGLKNLNLSLTSAKLPNPDLITSLEVLLNGRPQLPSYNFLPRKNLSPTIILKTLQNLNISLAIRLSLLDELPRNFYKYQIKDGRVNFNVEKNFQCCLSIADDIDDASQFFLLDFKFNFNFKDNSIIYDQETSLFKAHQKLENISNQLLLQNKLNQSGGLVELNNLLSQYTLNYKLFLIHRQLISLRVGYWKSQISHTYSADKNLILIHYWLKLQPNKKRSSSSFFEISLTDDKLNMQLKWFKDSNFFEVIPNFDLQTEELNIENTLTNFTEKHVNFKIMQLYEQLVKVSPSSVQLKQSSTSSPTLSLILQLNSTKNVIISISPLSGLLYFNNPTPFISSFLPSLNQTLAMNFQRLPFQILSIILKTNMELLDSLMNSTDWILNQIRISDVSKIVGKTTIDEELISLKYYRRHDWPQGWFLITRLKVDSTSSPVHIDWFVARIKLYLGSWAIQWCEELKISKNENIYETLNDLSIIARSSLLSQLITEDLQKNNAKLKILNSNDNLPYGITTDGGPILLIKNSSVFQISNCHENLFVKVELNNLSCLKISIIGKLKNFKINELHDQYTKDTETTFLDYSTETNIFEVKSTIDGNVLPSTELTTASIISSSTLQTQREQHSLISSSIELLQKFSKMLNILSLLSKESITIVSNNLSTIEILFDGDLATLNISNGISFKFNDENPYNLLSLQISDFSSKFGLLKTLKILKLTSPIIHNLSNLDTNFTLIIHELNFYKILYSLTLSIAINIEFDKDIVLIKFENSKQPIDQRLLNFLKENFNGEKLINDLLIFQINKFNQIITKICDFIIKEL